MTKKQKKRLFRIITAAILLAAVNLIPTEGILRLFVFLAPYLIVGYDVLRKAVLGVINGQIFDENFLMAVATLGALVLAVLKTGEYNEAVAVMLFYQLGEFFQSYAVGKSRKNIGELMDIRPDYANVEIGGKLEKVDPNAVEVGAEIVILPGEKIPLDGVVTEGASALDTAALTGESVPKSVAPGDEVYSGCVNVTGVLKLRVTKKFEESTVSKILRLVEDSAARKSKPEAFISKFAKIYTPAVCVAALLLAAVPPLFTLIFTNGDPAVAEWIYRALTFLVISCPCALVISIPLGFFAAIGGASKKGILVKGSNLFEVLAKAKTVIFDKTGTLTEGVFQVTEIRGADPCNIMEIAAHAESASTHPIAKSVIRAYGQEPDRSRVGNIRELGGNGIVATVDGKEAVVGNERLMQAFGIEFSRVRAEGTAVHVAHGGLYLGSIFLSDKIRNSAFSAIRALKKAGVRELIMLTGDVREVAESVAERLGMDKVYSGLLPHGKVEVIEEIFAEKRSGSLVFVGDGINDAPVLSRADIGVAMGAMGSDAAIEAADVVLMDDEPLKVAVAIRIARRTMAVIYQNIVFSLAVKFLCLALGALGVANLWIAIFADVGVMVLAVLNSIRLLFMKF